MDKQNFSLRLSTKLYKALKDKAEKNRRSINSEIIIALEKYLYDKELES